MGKRTNKKKIQEGVRAETNQSKVVADKDLPTTECPGTFRWREDKKFPSLPTFPVLSCPPISSFKGWADYLMWRGNGNPKLMLSVKDDPSLIDCLSFPLTVMYMMSALNLQPSITFHFVSLGASRRAEEFTFRNTSVWLDLAKHFPRTQVRLYFVGPETSCTESVCCDVDNMSCNIVKGSLDDLKRVHPEVFTDLTSSLFTIFNGGFGNFAESNRYELLWSWLPDLQWLTQSGVPLFFTCANDYGDVRGEVAVMKTLGAKMIICPQENKFSFATTLVGEGQAAEEGNYSRGNSFLYAVSGIDLNHRAELDKQTDKSSMQRLVLRAMLSKLEWLVGNCPDWGTKRSTSLTQTENTTQSESAKKCNQSARVENEINDTYSVSESDGVCRVMVKTEGGLHSMASACLDVFTNKVKLKWKDERTSKVTKLAIPLPCAIIPSKAHASFSKRKQLVTIVLTIAHSPN